MIPLLSKMNNGATVSDWLGTAGLAARAAGRDIELLRLGSVTEHGALQVVIDELEQALEEVKHVQNHCARLRHA